MINNLQEIKFTRAGTNYIPLHLFVAVLQENHASNKLVKQHLHSLQTSSWLDAQLSILKLLLELQTLVPCLNEFPVWQEDVFVHSAQRVLCSSHSLGLLVVAL
jgi:hypothetical protein